MNANELADWVEKQSSFGWSGDFGKFLIEIATMLRQQAKELDEAGHMIGVLREYISDLENGLDSSIKLNKAQAERQVKELTDEDYKEALACLQFALDDTMDYLTLNKLGGENNHWLVWARAILRKAQEK